MRKPENRFCSKGTRSLSALCVAKLAALGLSVLLPAAQSLARDGEGGATSDAPAAAPFVAAHPAAAPDHELVQQLLAKIVALEDRVAEMESKEELKPLPEASFQFLPALAESTLVHPAMARPFGIARPGEQPVPNETPAPPPGPPQMDSGGGHTMDIPGGPKLNIRGFLDFNFDAGSAANPLIYPLTTPPSTIHNTGSLICS